MPFPHSHSRSRSPEDSDSNWNKKAFIPLEDPDPSTDRLSGKTAREGGLSSTTHSISLSPTSRPKVAWYNSDENDVEKTSVSHVGTVAVDSRGEEDGDHSDMSIRLRRLFYWGFLCPPLWLLGFIMYTFRFFPGRNMLHGVYTPFLYLLSHLLESE
ncbi:hypothetical protein K435DRAFT_421186 [Dendrothele bispora CBS 962.96]|uniref:Uncharacterized protein n=1 Tax=Dendrothele bispora (strain CBS 962.96) TaxID=1314807 RepID=A0A4S8MFR1_DENBC|nr:hypothetical protein K435DRAFT_421186 [Dendrothele bispora CBS 962.96]